MGDTQVACNPLNSRRVPVAIEQPENKDLREKESILRSTKYTEPAENNCQKPTSPTKSQKIT